MDNHRCYERDGEVVRFEVGDRVTVDAFESDGYYSRPEFSGKITGFDDHVIKVKDDNESYCSSYDNNKVHHEYDALYRLVAAADAIEDAPAPPRTPVPEPTLAEALDMMAAMVGLRRLPGEDDNEIRARAQAETRWPFKPLPGMPPHHENCPCVILEPSLAEAPDRPVPEEDPWLRSAYVPPPAAAAREYEIRGEYTGHDQALEEEYGDLQAHRDRLARHGHRIGESILLHGEQGSGVLLDDLPHAGYDMTVQVHGGGYLWATFDDVDRTGMVVTTTSPPAPLLDHPRCSPAAPRRATLDLSGSYIGVDRGDEV